VKSTYKLKLDSVINAYSDLPLSLWIGILSTFVESTTCGLIFFIPIYFVKGLNLTIQASSTLISIYAFGSIISGVVTGHLTDKYRPKNIIVFCLFLQTLAFISLAGMSDIFKLKFILFLFGFSTYGFSIAMTMSMLNACRGNKTLEYKFLNISKVAMNLGFGIIGGSIYFININNFKYIFYDAAIILTLTTSTVLFSASTTSDPLENSNFPNTSHKTLNKKTLGFLFFCTIAIGILISQLSCTYPIFIEKNYSLGIKGVGILFILDTILIGLFQAPLNHSIRKLNKLSVVGTGALFMGLSFITLNGKPTFIIAIISCILWTFGEIIFIPAIQFLIYSNANFKYKGKSLGIYQSLMGISKVLGPILGSYIYQNSGSRALWQISGAIGFIVFFACILYKKNSF
jgi:MFS family permease